ECFALTLCYHYLKSARGSHGPPGTPRGERGHGGRVGPLGPQHRPRIQKWDPDPGGRVGTAKWDISPLRLPSTFPSNSFDLRILFFYLLDYSFEIVPKVFWGCPSTFFIRGMPQILLK